MIPINEITGQVIGCAMRVHSTLGPGLLESAYTACLVHELREKGLVVQTEVACPIEYNGLHLEAGYRLDLLVENRVVVELKAVETVHPVFYSQLLTYLRLSRLQVGLLINFHVEQLKDGIKRVVNNYVEETH